MPALLTQLAWRCSMGNGINWKGQVFPQMRNFTASHKVGPGPAYAGSQPAACMCSLQSWLDRLDEPRPACKAAAEAADLSAQLCVQMTGVGNALKRHYANFCEHYEAVRRPCCSPVHTPQLVFAALLPTSCGALGPT